MGTVFVVWGPWYHESVRNPILRASCEDLLRHVIFFRLSPTFGILDCHHSCCRPGSRTSLHLALARGFSGHIQLAPLPSFPFFQGACSCYSCRLRHHCPLRIPGRWSLSREVVRAPRRLGSIQNESVSLFASFLELSFRHFRSLLVSFARAC